MPKLNISLAFKSYLAPYLYLLIISLLTACQHTQDNNVAVKEDLNAQPLDLNLPINIPVNKPVTPAKTDEELAELTLHEHINQNSKTKQIDDIKTAEKNLIDIYSQLNQHTKQNNVSSPSSTEDFHHLLNKHVCKNNVDVSYQLPSASGTNNSYQAKVQIQAKVIKLADTQDKALFQITNWYSDNENLMKWRPYLKNAPLAQGMNLILYSKFWHNLDGWFVCLVSQRS